MYGRIMEPADVAEQIVNALAARETLRRIAITPAYPESLDSADEHANDHGDERGAVGARAVELARSRGR